MPWTVQVKGEGSEDVLYLTVECDSAEKAITAADSYLRSLSITQTRRNTYCGTIQEAVKASRDLGGINLIHVKTPEPTSKTKIVWKNVK